MHSPPKMFDSLFEPIELKWLEKNQFAVILLKRAIAAAPGTKLHGQSSHCHVLIVSDIFRNVHFERERRWIGLRASQSCALQFDWNRSVFDSFGKVAVDFDWFEKWYANQHSARRKKGRNDNLETNSVRECFVRWEMAHEINSFSLFRSQLEENMAQLPFGIDDADQFYMLGIVFETETQKLATGSTTGSVNACNWMSLTEPSRFMIVYRFSRIFVGLHFDKWTFHHDQIQQLGFYKWNRELIESSAFAHASDKAELYWRVLCAAQWVRDQSRVFTQFLHFH